MKPHIRQYTSAPLHYAVVAAGEPSAEERPRTPVRVAPFKQPKPTVVGGITSTDEQVRPPQSGTRQRTMHGVAPERVPRSGVVNVEAAPQRPGRHTVRLERKPETITPMMAPPSRTTADAQQRGRQTLVMKREQPKPPPLPKQSPAANAPAARRHTVVMEQARPKPPPLPREYLGSLTAAEELEELEELGGSALIPLKEMTAPESVTSPESMADTARDIGSEPPPSSKEGALHLSNEETTVVVEFTTALSSGDAQKAAEAFSDLPENWKEEMFQTFLRRFLGDDRSILVLFQQKLSNEEKSVVIAFTTILSTGDARTIAAAFSDLPENWKEGMLSVLLERFNGDHDSILVLFQQMEPEWKKILAKKQYERDQQQEGNNMPASIPGSFFPVPEEEERRAPAKPPRRRARAAAPVARDTGSSGNLAKHSGPIERELREGLEQVRTPAPPPGVQGWTPPPELPTVSRKKALPPPSPRKDRTSTAPSLVSSVQEGPRTPPRRVPSEPPASSDPRSRRRSYRSDSPPPASPRGQRNSDPNEEDAPTTVFQQKSDVVSSAPPPRASAPPAPPIPSLTPPPVITPRSGGLQSPSQSQRPAPASPRRGPLNIPGSDDPTVMGDQALGRLDDALKLAEFLPVEMLPGHIEDWSRQAVTCSEQVAGTYRLAIKKATDRVTKALRNHAQPAATAKTTPSEESSERTSATPVSPVADLARIAREASQPTTSGNSSILLKAFFFVALVAMATLLIILIAKMGPMPGKTSSPHVDTAGASTNTTDKNP